ncbi:MAG TPA: hypothetical protein VI818_05500, partial [Candidatus Thermoplasmatota archaeon]|nr:hypothetical protein [Candidatus Thermoplasmatota archaeon]
MSVQIDPLRSRTLVVGLLVLAAAVPGCVNSPSPGAGPVPGSGAIPGVEAYTIGCRILDEDRQPLSGATCHYAFEGFSESFLVNAEGYAQADVPVNTTGKVRGTADGRITKAATLRVDAPKVVEMVLEKLAEGATPSPTVPPTTIGT